MTPYLVIKTLHILSATLLFGTGLGTAFHMWMTHLRRDARAVAVTARNVVLADWSFTATSGVVQPVSGVVLVMLQGYDPMTSWLLVSYALYLIAGACWLRVVALQMRVARIAACCVAEAVPLPAAYFRAMDAWFWLGWPAFIGLLGVFWLMVAKPELW
jgi:uncharacterized membrane protein